MSDAIFAACPSCSVSRVFQVLSTDTRFVCPSGHASDFVRCTNCQTYFQSPDERRKSRMACPRCGAADRPASVQAGETEWVNADQRPASDKDRRTLYHFTLAASGGSSLVTGSDCTLVFATDGVKIESRGEVEPFPYDQVLALEVAGATTTTRRGGGFVGGGFGIEGAVEGMLAASVLNALTRSSQTHINTILRLATLTAEYVFVSHLVDGAALRLSLTPVQLRIRQAQMAPPISKPGQSLTMSGVADEIRKMAELRDEGLLSDAEFTSAKLRLLTG